MSFRNIRVFNYVTTDSDRNVDWNGWRMEGMPHFDPSVGMAVAHDSLEHFPNTQKDSLVDEMLAFGSIFRNRVQGGYWQNNNYWRDSQDKMLGYDILRFLSEHQWHISFCETRMSTHVKKMLLNKEQFKDMVHGEQWDDSWEEDGYQESLNNAWKTYIHAMRWVSVGYRMAQERWGSHNPYDVTCMFQDIEREVDAIKFAEAGDKLEVKFNIKDLSYQVIHTPYYELEENYY
jgi:hypothetical protein